MTKHIFTVGGPNTKLKRKERRRLKKAQKIEGWSEFVDEIDKQMANGWEDD